MEIQIINKQPLILRIENEEYQFVKPYFLYRNFGEVIKGAVKGSTLGWNIKGVFVSYNQLKKLYDVGVKI